MRKQVFFISISGKPSLNIIDLLALTIAGPTRQKPVLDHLAVQHLKSQLCMLFYTLSKLSNLSVTLIFSKSHFIRTHLKLIPNGLQVNIWAQPNLLRYFVKPENYILLCFIEYIFVAWFLGFCFNICFTRKEQI